MQRMLEEAELPLVEQRLDGFKTNVLVERAGVCAIDRNFPNHERSWSR